MDRIRFCCSECETTLGVNPDLAGKPIICPKCRERTVVPLVEEEEARQPIRFACSKCRTKLKVLGQLAGRTIPCPRCGENTIVPDADEVGAYSFAGASQSDADDDCDTDGPPLDEWWPDVSELNLPGSWRIALASARTHTEAERWTKALGLLNDLFQKGLRVKGKNDTHVLRKPLAYCLGRWAVRELDRIDDDKAKLSKPIRQVLKKAADLKRWNGSLSNSECTICGRKLLHLVGTTQVRTVAGSAYLCCAKPTSQDDELIRRVDRINKKLTLAGSLDPDNRQVPAAMKKLPEWYRAVDVYKSGWTKSVDGTLEHGGGTAAGGSIAGDIAGNMVGNLLSDLLFG